MKTLLILLSVCVGILLGHIFWPRPIPISERINSCEAKGGKYGYYYNDISRPGYYYEKCNIVDDEIHNF